MTPTKRAARGNGAIRMIDSIDDAEKSALEAVRRFLDTVDGAFPAASEDGPRRKIIDSAFKMTEQLVSASNQLAQRVVRVTEKALSESGKNVKAAKRTAAKKTAPRKTAAKKMAAKKTAPRKTAPRKTAARRKAPASKR